MLGAHGDRLHINRVREPFEAACLRGLDMSGVIVSRAFSAISGGAGAASCCNDLLDRFWADHSGVIADVDNICAPIDVDSGNVRLRAKGLLDRIGALDAVDIFEGEC
jgi:hypothetical protein